MRFRLLGPLRIWDGKSWTPIRAEQQRLVLAVLLIEAGNVVTTNRLIDEIWGERPPRTALVTVQGYVRRLRTLLGDGAHGLLRTRERGYELAVPSGGLDAGIFERLLDTANRDLAGGDRSTAVARLAEALELWRGPALGDVPSTPTVAAEVARLEQRRLTAVEERLGALLDLGRHADVIDELRDSVRAHPLHERLRLRLMLALYLCDRRAEALDAYRDAHRVLVAEHGLEPGPALQKLYRQVLANDRSPAALPATAGTGPAQLPADVANFTGRNSQLAQLDTLLPAAAGAPYPMLVISTIAGTAGVGKTALAVHWAHRVRARFPDGQLYVSMRGDAAGRPLRPIDALAHLLSALGVPAEQVPADLDVAAGLYRTLLTGRRMLVLIDSANHPDQVRPLLPGTPECMVLITSRDQLRGLVARDGAVRLDLDVLAQDEANRLLVNLIGTAHWAQPKLIAELARLCGRLPLALRIVAANLAATHPRRSLAELVAELLLVEQTRIMFGP